jgi:uncharacterized protein YjbI with pentapeptide repeats
MNKEELGQLTATKLIEDVDLSDIDLTGYDFSDCTLKNVSFAPEGCQCGVLKDINFKNARLQDISFEYFSLDNCDFDGGDTSLSRVSFNRSVLKKCRFRKAKISWCDFRYAEIHSATLENAQIDFCDFYRAVLSGVTIFRKSRISNSSLFYTHFDGGATIRRENLFQGKLLQQDEEAYRHFLNDWRSFGTGQRKNEQERQSDWSPSESLRARFADAEDIYKTLNGLWMSNGFLSDANWAYVKGRRMERRRMVRELSNSETTFPGRVSNVVRITWNGMSDLMFGYGESIVRMILSYVFVVFLFAYLYFASSEVSLPTYAGALGVSFKNMVAMSSGRFSGISPLIDFLNLVQTTIGILLTGIFGFILGNKIRNQ